MMNTLKEYQDLYLNDALFGYGDFNNDIKKIEKNMGDDFFEITLKGYNDNFVSFYMDDDDHDKIIITTNVFGYTQESVINDNVYYSGHGYISNITKYSFVELFKYYDFEEAFKISKTFI